MNRRERDRDERDRDDYRPNRGISRRYNDSTFDREFEGGINDDDDYTGRSSRRGMFGAVGQGQDDEEAFSNYPERGRNSDWSGAMGRGSDTMQGQGNRRGSRREQEYPQSGQNRQRWNLSDRDRERDRDSQSRNRYQGYGDFDEDEDDNRRMSRYGSSRESIYGTNENRSSERGYGAREDRDYRTQSLDRGRDNQRGYYSESRRDRDFDEDRDWDQEDRGSRQSPKGGGRFGRAS